MFIVHSIGTLNPHFLSAFPVADSGRVDHGGWSVGGVSPSYPQANLRNRGCTCWACRTLHTGHETLSVCPLGRISPNSRAMISSVCLIQLYFLLLPVHNLLIMTREVFTSGFMLYSHYSGALRMGGRSSLDQMNPTTTSVKWYAVFRPPALLDGAPPEPSAL